MQHAHDGEAPTQMGQSTHHGSVNRATYQEVKQLFLKDENNVGKAPTQTGQSMQQNCTGSTFCFIKCMQ
jgi:hypothetical protein